MKRLCQEQLQRDTCDDDELGDPKARDTLVRLAHSGSAPVIVSLHGSIAEERFSYRDRIGLASESQSHTSWAAGFGAGRFLPGFGYLALEYEHHRRFHAGETANLCETVAPALMTCRSVVLGGPTGQGLDIAALEWRFFFRGGRVAMNPSTTHDFRNAASAVDIPVYFLALSSGGLAGGARASWRSDTHDVAVGFFVGTALRPTP
jgi:hypothetical protein